jgi:leader peptidase (prepilin peptidase)/N-methyltransferase
METFNEINRLLPWFLPVAAAVFGACIGSFLNVCIYRIPKNESIVRPGSHCGCGQPIAWHDNIPVLSWLILRGRARCCGRPFSIRYPAVELLTAALFLGCWLLFPPGKAVAGMVLCSLLICATFIDLDHMVIPDAFTLGGALTGVLLSLALPDLHGHRHEIFFIASTRSAIDAVLGLLIGSALVLWIALFAEAVLKKEAMGFGDVKFLGAIGAFIGWKGAVFAVFGGAVVGCVWFAFAVLWQQIMGRPQAPAGDSPAPMEGSAVPPVPLGFGVQVPFGPMLAIAALIYFLVLHRWVDAYFADLAVLL